MAGVRVIRAHERTTTTSQTTNMRREAAIEPDEQASGPQLWMGLVTTPAGGVSGWHHHGDCVSGIYIVSGRARFSWGPGGSESAEVGPGDFLAVAPGAIHMEQALGDEPLVLVVARGAAGTLVVNTDGPEQVGG
ncbi:MAG TPA: cupin domain-containing protein [Ktedonobacterales bacterium]|nr:cupin domain-containing protein [Ktedonobacterales bacterium]